ncbi:MAG: hypothetical protein AAF267_19500 [Deinococcota bacterium]
MSYKRFSITLLTTLGLILLAACGGSEGPSNPDPDPTPGNTAPTRTGSIPNVTAVITEGSQTLNLGDFFSDAQDSDTELTYSVTNNSNNAAVNATTSSTILNLEFLAVGSSTLTITVTDTGGLSTTATVTVTVNPGEGPPPQDASFQIDAASSTCTDAIVIGDTCSVIVNLVNYDAIWYTFLFDVTFANNNFALRAGTQGTTDLTSSMLILAGPQRIAAISDSLAPFTGSGPLVEVLLERVGNGSDTMRIQNGELTVDLDQGTTLAIDGDNSNAVF